VIDLELRLPSVPRPAPLQPTLPAGAIGGWVLDISALLAFADATAYAACVRALAARGGRTLLVALPALAVAAARRSGIGAQRLAGLLSDATVVVVDGSVAAGSRFDRLVDRAGGDRLAALVVLLATERGWPVLTDRGEALCRLRPDLLVIPS
jgi:hypothetical protein